MAGRRSTKQEDQPVRVNTYGILTPPPDRVPPQNWYDQNAFAFKITLERTPKAPNRVEVCWKLTNLLSPGFLDRNPWSDRMIDALCKNSWLGMAGCGSSGKTRSVVGFACTWWLVAPALSSVIFCSTTVKALRKRGWGDVQKYFYGMPCRMGNFVDSRMLWQATKGDDKHAIAGIAVEEGALTKVSDNIKGWHTERQMVVVDEATAVPQAIFEACTNLYAGAPREFIMVLMGNPRSRLDQFGKFCEPLGGWDSVNVETEEWETKPQLDGKSGIVLRFDAEKSPNIVEGKIVAKYLPTKEKVEGAKRALANSPEYWSNYRGFWAPEGLAKTLFSEVGMVTHDASGRQKFTGKDFQIIGAFDHARTGDRPVFRPAAIGEIEGGGWGIELMSPIVVPLDSRLKVPVDFQHAASVRKICANISFRGTPGYACPPENLGVDATGGGADFCDILEREFSPEIIRVQFGGAPSDDACSIEDMRPASDVYENKRVEMFYRARNALLAHQLKGIDVDTQSELCHIEYRDQTPTGQAKKKIGLMSKAEYKALFGKSPDLADTVAIILEVARRKGFRLAPVGKTVTRSLEWDAQVAKCDSVYSDIDYSNDPSDEVDSDSIYASSID